MKTIKYLDIRKEMNKKYKEVKNKKILKKIENKLFDYVKKYYPDKFNEMIDFHLFFLNKDVGYVLELAFYKEVMTVTTLVFSEKKVDIDNKYGFGAYESFLNYEKIKRLKRKIKYKFI